MLPRIWMIRIQQHPKALFLGKDVMFMAAAKDMKTEVAQILMLLLVQVIIKKPFTFTSWNLLMIIVMSLIVQNNYESNQKFQLKSNVMQCNS